MNVAMIPRRFTTSSWGGTETVVLETSKRLGSRGHEVGIHTPKCLSPDMHEEIQGVPVHRYSYCYPFLGLSSEDRERMDLNGGNLFSFPLLRALGKAPRLDLVHLHTLKRLGGIGRHVAKRRGIPYVVTIHGGVTDVPADERERLLEPIRGRFEWGKALGWWVGSRRVLDDAAAIVCVSDVERDNLQARYPGKRVVRIPNGVDVARFSGGDGPAFRFRHGLAREAFVLLQVGRIDPQKNQLASVRALAALAEKHDDLHLVLIGPVTDPTYASIVREEADRLGVASRITRIEGLAPDDPELFGAYAAADLSLVPSMHEPFGIVVLEAWSAGVAVLASRVGGIPGFVEDGRDAVLHEPGDTDTMIQRIERLYLDDTRRRGLARAGHRKAKQEYDWEVVTGQLEALYEEVTR